MSAPTPRPREDREIALECLRLAIANVTSAAPASALVNSAATFFEFVTGYGQPSAREQINSALDAANVR